MIIGTILFGIILGIFLWGYYNYTQFDEPRLGKKVFQFGKPLLMYIGSDWDIGDLYYDGRTAILFKYRNQWCQYKSLGNNEQLMHLKGIYEYGNDWVTAWKTFDAGSARETVKAAKRYSDSTPKKIYINDQLVRNIEYNPKGQIICNVFLWVRNARNGDYKWREYHTPWSEI